MESELSSQRNCLVVLIPKTFGMLKLGKNHQPTKRTNKNTFGLGLKQNCIPNNCIQRSQGSRRYDYGSEN